MFWQDWVLTVGTVIFALALVPSLMGKDKPALSTSLLTGLVLLVFAAVFYTLSLSFSSISNGITAILWLVLAFQKYRQDR